MNYDNYFQSYNEIGEEKKALSTDNKQEIRRDNVPDKYQKTNKFSTDFTTMESHKHIGGDNKLSVLLFYFI